MSERNHHATAIKFRGNDDGKIEYTIDRRGSKDSTLLINNIGRVSNYMPHYISVFTMQRAAEMIHKI